MLKLFSKTILVSLLSMTLLLSHVTAYAQTVSNTQTTTQTLTGTSDNNMLSSITMLAIGLIATRLYKYKLTTDMMLAAAGGLVFIYAEISTIGKFKDLEKDLKLEVAKNAAGQPDAAQIDHIKGLKKSYVEASNILKSKKTLQIVAAAAFAAAAVVAYTMKTIEKSAFDACLFALNTQKTSCYDTITNGPPGTSVNGIDETNDRTWRSVHKVANAREIPQNSERGSEVVKNARGYMDEFLNNLYNRIDRRTEWAKQEAATATAGNPNAAAAIGLVAACPVSLMNIKSTCGTLSKLLEEDESSGTMAIENLPSGANYYSPLIKKLIEPTFITSTEAPRINPNAFERLLDLAMPKAEAGSMGMMFGLGGVGAALLMNMQKDLGDYVDRFLLTPSKRAMVWGVLAGLTFMSSMSTQSEIDKIDQNIKKIDGILNATVQVEKHNFFEIFLNIFVSKVNAETAKVIAAPVRTPKDLSSQVRMPCLAGPGDTNCPSLTAKLNSAAGFSDLPSSFQKVVAQITHFADELNGATSLSAKSMADASKIASQHSAINDLLKKTQNDITAQAEKDGVSGPDFAQSEKMFLGYLNNITARALDKGKTTPAAFLASYGGKALVGTDASSNPAASAQKKTGPIGATNVVTSVPAEQNKAVAVAATEKVEQKVYKVNDISTNKDESIWTVISNRYFKSAFPKFFDQ